MRILVTGGAGFQGSHLVEYLMRAGHEITILNTPSARAEENISPIVGDITVLWGSVTDREAVVKAVNGQEVVFHLAAHVNVDESVARPHSYLEVNVGGTLNVLEAIREEGARMIFSSSREVYGNAVNSPVTEDAELRPHNPYAVSKTAADRMCFAYHTTYGLDVTIIRSCNIYGERQKSGPGGALISILGSQAANGKPLTVFGSGSQRREYMHVTDLVRAYDLVLERSDVAGTTMKVGSGETASVKEIAEFIGHKMGAPITNQPARPGEVPGITLDSSKIRDLGFTPKIKFWEGLADYLDGLSRISARR